MSRPNEYKTSTSEFESVSDALKALDNLMKDVNKRKRDAEGSCESARNFRAHVGGLKQCVESVFDSSIESWKSIELDRSFCQKSEKMTKDEFRFVMLFMHPIYEQVWLSDPEGRNVAAEYVPFFEFELEYVKDARKIVIGRAVLEKMVHLPEMSASFSATQGELEVIKNETLRVDAVNQAALTLVEQVTREVANYCGENRLEFEGQLPEGDVQKAAGKGAASGSGNGSSVGDELDVEGGLDVGLDDVLGGDDVLEYIDDDLDEELTNSNPEDSEVIDTSLAEALEEVEMEVPTKSSSKKSGSGGKSSRKGSKNASASR